ncbi:tyrosine-type recombinase/integrase [Alkalicoccobacillus murimartini]|uniref:Integrase/recombinase XerD n=1 Tax=Alkalicoccobacillus murimartini TaxID=171685 RepID=A0ABT9YDG0_9BACI|nr:tyrosine-type recombinase/integrase [Alkalicoccobacillus murimartini]MDQ0205227.1 integrase/recombinase XerD [Alkalicoccobacillus murimartini]
MTRRSNELSVEELSVIKTVKVVKDINFKTALTFFIDDCEIRNLRPQTIQYYKNELSALYKLLKENEINPEPSHVNRDDIKTIILTMKEKGLQTVTINTRLRAVRAFFNFLHRERHISSNPLSEISLLKDRRKVVETFTTSQLDQIFNQPNLRSFVGVRDYTFMLVLLETGIRVSELEGICVQDIMWNESKLHIRNTKTYKERLVPIQNKMKTQLQKYIQVRGRLDSDSLFVTLDGKAMSKRQYQNRVTFYGKQAIIKGVRCSCHTFRHTFAKLSVKNGAGIFELQQILGHTSMDMVRVYVNLFSDDVIEKHKSFSPLKNIQPSR